MIVFARLYAGTLALVFPLYIKDNGMLKRLSLLLFDLDGTLLDSETALAVGFNRALAQFGVANDIADTTSYYRAWADIQREDFARYLMGEEEFDANRLERTVSLLHLMSGIEPEIYEAQEFLTVLQAEAQAAWMPFEEVSGFFERLHQWHPHVQVAALSNGSKRTEQAKLDAIGLGHMRLLPLSS